MALPVIKIEHLKHRGNQQIALYFKYDSMLISCVKEIEGFKWSATHKCWYIKNSAENLKKIFKKFKGIARIERGEFFKMSKGVQDKDPRRDTPSGPSDHLPNLPVTS